MRWIKHLTSAHHDEAMAEIMDIWGAAGYGMWWLILEKIGHHMDNTDRCSARFSIKTWAKTCRISPKKFQNFVKFLAENKKIILKTEKDYITIECPNLLKYKDEYAKKRAKNGSETPDNIRTNSGQTPEQDTETETDPETEIDPKESNSNQEHYDSGRGFIFSADEILSPRLGDHDQVGNEGLPNPKKSSGGVYSTEFEMFWAAFPPCNRKTGKPKAFKAWQTLRLDKALPEVLGGLDIWKRSKEWVKDGGDFICLPATFLNQRRWEDPPLGGQRSGAVILNKLVDKNVTGTNAWLSKMEAEVDKE